MAVDIFGEISIIIVIATAIAVLMRLLRQPLVIGYILTGLFVGSAFLNVIHSTETIITFSQIGVAFLLFIVGLGLSPRVIKDVGKVSVVTGVGQVIFTSLIGFFIAHFLGFSTIESIYIAAALTFSSTIIIMKLLSDKRDLESLYGKIAVGFLIVQDIIAVIILLIISSFANKNTLTDVVAVTLANGLLLTGIFLFLVSYLLPKLGNFFAKSQEFLFLFSISLGLGMATLSHYLGFSLEIGALIAGVALSMTPYSYEISSKMRPLRDFFIIIFFIVLGSQIALTDVIPYVFPIVIFSLFILIGKPLIVMILMGILGYPKRVSFSAGLTVAQISEFSLILVALVVKVGHLAQELLSVVTVVGLVTITGSTYFIIYSDKLYALFAPFLGIFEKKGIGKETKKRMKYDIILFGYNRIGFGLMQTMLKLKKRFLIVDYNPDIIASLSADGIQNVYGDAGNMELLDGLHLERVKMIISTIPDGDTNKLLLKKLREVNKKSIAIVVSHHNNEAYQLYQAGASYVMMPHFLGGAYVSLLLEKFSFHQKKFASERKKHLEQLNKRMQIGHEHPRHERNG